MQLMEGVPSDMSDTVLTEPKMSIPWTEMEGPDYLRGLPIGGSLDNMVCEWGAYMQHGRCGACMHACMHAARCGAPGRVMPPSLHLVLPSWYPIHDMSGGCALIPVCRFVNGCLCLYVFLLHRLPVYWAGPHRAHELAPPG